MKPPFAQLAAGGMASVALLVGACSTPHAVPARCSGPLRPINAAAARPATVSRSDPAAVPGNPATPRGGA